MAANDPTLERAIRDALGDINDPCSVAAGTPLSLEAMGLIERIDISAGHVGVAIRLTSPTCIMLPFFTDQIESRVGGIDGVDDVRVTFDQGLDWSPDLLSDEVKAERKERLARRSLKLLATHPR